MGIKTVPVRLGDRSYDIQIGRGLLPAVGKVAQSLRLGKKTAVVTDKAVGKLYAKTVLTSLEDAGFDPLPVEIAPGEKSKTLATAEKVWDAMLEKGLDRSSFIVALGGGVVGDLAGFVASVYLRGIPFIQVPTTLLAQVDSSVGGKVAVDVPQGKNLIGSFYQPRAVLIDTAVLQTLPARELKAGMAEVVKYGVIWDRAFFDFLAKNMEKLLGLDDELLAAAIAKSCEIKAIVVEMDEKESGLRAVLNFGHTFGHACEAAGGYKALLHGEAISAGMVAAAEMSRRLEMCPVEVVKAVRDLLLRTGLPVCLKGLDAGEVLKHMRYDKKASAGRLRFVLVEKIGKVSVRSDVPSPLVESIVKDTLLNAG